MDDSVQIIPAFYKVLVKRDVAHNSFTVMVSVTAIGFFMEELYRAYKAVEELRNMFGIPHSSHFTYIKQIGCVLPLVLTGQGCKSIPIIDVSLISIPPDYLPTFHGIDDIKIRLVNHIFEDQDQLVVSIKFPLSFINALVGKWWEYLRATINQQNLRRFLMGITQLEAFLKYDKVRSSLYYTIMAQVPLVLSTFLEEEKTNVR